MNKASRLRYSYPFIFWDLLCRLIIPFPVSRVCHKAGSSVQIPDDFFGINIASSHDDRCDDYTIARLQELGISNVRLAFSYCSVGGPASRLLEKLLEQNFVVALVVLPPREAAKKMRRDHHTQNEWRQFLHEVFSRYAQRVEFFEIGSTPNRKKWSGFNPRSYLHSWEIACDVAKVHPVTLAGPNIQDFEPYHNANLLFAMRHRSRVPEIHTNNLFVERVVEPEAYDHRVLGRWATNLLKLNLVKKARLLQYVGGSAGCHKTISTCNFWTTKRLKRRSADPQQKQADYLVRYLVLAATSGALSRVYWGPLICGRDGLIDDCSQDYPDIDHSAFYRSLRGEVADYVISPAFYALAHVVRRLRNAYCLQATSEVDNLNHFSFTGPENELFHICWCRDRQTIKLTDVFSGQQLASAVFTDACGKIVDKPQVTTEQPLFIDFPGTSMNHSN